MTPTPITSGVSEESDAAFVERMALLWKAVRHSGDICRLLALARRSAAAPSDRDVTDAMVIAALAEYVGTDRYARDYDPLAPAPSRAAGAQMSEGKWRVEPNTELRGAILDYVVMAGDFAIGLFSSARIAASFVAQHNASGEAVAWRWKLRGGTGRWHLTDVAEQANYCEHTGRHEIQALYITPSPAPVDVVAVVEGLRAKWQQRDGHEMSAEFANIVIWASDEILAALKGNAR